MSIPKDVPIIAWFVLMAAEFLWGLAKIQSPLAFAPLGITLLAGLIIIGISARNDPGL